MKKSLYYRFKETSLSLAVDASIAHGQMRELEKTVDYESFMRESIACESVYPTKNSNLEIPGLPVGLFDSVEQTALTSAEATLLMKAMLGRWQTSKMHGKKKAERLAGEKKTKLLNDMSMMKPSELWKVAVDDRVRSLLKSESSQKSKGKGKSNGKTKRLTLVGRSG